MSGEEGARAAPRGGCPGKKAREPRHHEAWHPHRRVGYQSAARAAGITTEHRPRIAAEERMIYRIGMCRLGENGIGAADGPGAQDPRINIMAVSLPKAEAAARLMDL